MTDVSTGSQALPPALIDTHTHLTDEPLASALDAVLGRARAAGVVHCIVPGYNEASWRLGRQLAAQQPHLSFAIGIHPLFPAIESIAAFDAELARGGMVAIGEIGLDYAAENADRTRQLALFRHQLRRAHKARLPVILHCRHAHDDLLAVLRETPGIRGVMHSCSCSHEQADAFLDLGLFVGFSGIITRTGPKKVKKLAAVIPIDRLLAETDSPYIGTACHPVPTSEPADVAAVIASLAAIRSVSFDDMARMTTANSQRLFGF